MPAAGAELPAAPRPSVQDKDRAGPARRQWKKGANTTWLPKFAAKKVAEWFESEDVAILHEEREGDVVVFSTGHHDDCPDSARADLLNSRGQFVDQTSRVIFQNFQLQHFNTPAGDGAYSKELHLSFEGMIHDCASSFEQTSPTKRQEEEAAAPVLEALGWSRLQT